MPYHVKLGELWQMEKIVTKVPDDAYGERERGGETERERERGGGEYTTEQTTLGNDTGVYYFILLCQPYHGYCSHYNIIH